MTVLIVESSPNGTIYGVCYFQSLNPFHVHVSFGSKSTMCIAMLLTDSVQNASISPNDQKVERLLQVVQDTVHAKAENDKHPPADLESQIQYYTDIIRTVLRMFFCEPDLSAEQNFGPNTPFTPLPQDVPVVGGITTAIGTQRSGSGERQALNTSSTSRSVEQQNQGPNIGVSSSGVFNPAPGPSGSTSVWSPCSAETVGAGGESPMIMRPQGNTASRRSATGSPSQAQLQFPNGFRIPAQGIGALGASMTTPLTRSHSEAFGSQRHQQLRRSQHQPLLRHQQQQAVDLASQDTPHRLPSNVASTQAQFGANNFPGGFFSADEFHVQGDQDWGRLQMGQMPFQQGCISCSNAGFPQNPQLCSCGMYSGLGTQ